MGWRSRKCRLESKFKRFFRLPSVANDSWQHYAKELRAKHVDCAKVCIVVMPMLIQTCLHSFDGNHHEHNHHEEENDNNHQYDDMYENKKENNKKDNKETLRRHRKYDTSKKNDNSKSQEHNGSKDEKEIKFMLTAITARIIT